MKRAPPVLVAAAAAAALACACADPPLVEAPGARAVAVGRAADAVALYEAFVRAKLTAPVQGFEALVATAPMIVSVVPGGAIIVAARVSPSAMAAEGARVVLGGTRALPNGMLARVDGNRALVALHVEAGQENTVAALLEVMAAEKSAPPLTLPPPGSIAVRIADHALPIDVGAVSGTVVVTGDEVALTALAPHPSEDVARALRSKAPAWACFLDEGAAAVLSVPPVLVGDDAFEGRMTAALYPDGSVALAGVPRDVGALWSELDKDAGARTALAGGRTLVEVQGKRRLRAIRGDGLFVLAVGDAVPLEKLGAPCTSTSSLLRVDGAALARVLLPSLVSPQAILAALASGEATVPLAGLRGVARLDVDAAEKSGGGLALDVHLRLRSVPD